MISKQNSKFTLMMLLIEPIDKKIIHIECQCEDMVFKRENLKKEKSLNRK